MPDDESNIQFDDTGVIVKAASFHKLLEKLTSESGDHNLVLDFLMTYRSFCSGGHELLNSLIVREKTATTREIRINVFKVVTHWITKYWYDFEKDCPELGITCLQWLDGVITDQPESTGKVAQNLKDKLSRQLDPDKAKRIIEVSRKAAEVPPPSVRPKDLTSFHILQCDSEEIARQLTLMEWQLYSSIKMYELVGLAWTKKDKATKAANVLAIINRFNYVSEWVSTIVCMSERVKDRIKVIVKFIEVAIKLKSFNNFNGLMEIVSGLNRGPVHRLKASIEQAIEKTAKGPMPFQDLLTLTSSDHSYATLRRAIRTANPPCIPYLGMYLTDLTFIEEGNPNFLTQYNLINFKKRKQIAECIKDINTYQATGYVFTPVPEMQAKLKGEVTFDDDSLYELSYYLEPRAGKPQPPRPQLLIDGLPTKREDKTKALELEAKKEWNIFVVPDGPSNTVMGPNKKPKGLSLSKIIESITSGTPDPNSILIYLACLQLYTTPQAFLEILMARFDIPPPKDKSLEAMQTFRDDIQTPIYLNVIQILRLWITNFWGHFARDPQLTELLVHFVNGLIAHSLPQYSAQLNTDIHKKFSAGPGFYRVVDAYPAPLPIVPVGVDALNAEITDYDVLEFARQLTLFHSSIWIELVPELFLAVEEPREIADMRASSDQLVEWVVYEIKKHQKRGRCGVALEFMCSAMMHCQKLQNWHAVNAFITAFNRIIIINEWDQIKPEVSAFYKDFKNLNSRRTEELAQIHKTLYSPCVPILRYFTESVQAIHGSHAKNMLTDQIVNIEKMKLLGDVVLEVKRMQSVTYNLVPINSMREYIYTMRGQYYNQIDESSSHPFRSSIRDTLKDMLSRDEWKDQESSPLVKLVTSVVEEEMGILAAEDISMNALYSTDQIGPDIEEISSIFPEARIRDSVLSAFPESRYGIWCEMDHNCIVTPVPQNIKMNVVYQGNDIVLLEIKESISINEIVTLLKIGKFYKGFIAQETRLSCAILTKHISDEAYHVAETCNIQIIPCA